MKKTFTLLIASALILLSSCIFFQTINQPSVSLPNEIITVSITANTDGGDHEPYFGVCLPIGWTIPGDSLQCSGGYNEVIYYDDSLSIEQENASPAPQGYNWWVGRGVIDTSAVGVVYGDLQIQTDSQTGIFSTDYMLGNSYNGVNHQRSDDHLIEIVDNEYTPWRLQATINGGSIYLNWNQPLNVSGLLGYNIYRDEQKINSTIVPNTTFIDENPLEGIHNYCVSSLYNNGNEYMMSYEVQVMYGNSLYVSPNGSNTNSGSSFEEALLTINYGLSFITSDPLHHKTIYLSQGIFSPGTTGEVFPLEWKNNLSLQGISKEVTILDGDGLSGVAQFYSITEAEFENLTIRNGNGNGISCDNSSPELINVSITNFNGRGISCDQNSNPRLSNVIIANNYLEGGGYGGSGGGIACWDNSNPELINVIITNNSAGGYGGGIFCHKSSPSLMNVTITNNSAGSGGGISCHFNSSNPILINVTMTDNSAVGDGGGIYCYRGNPSLRNVTITNNSAGNNGGGIYSWSNSNPILKNCILWNDSLAEIYFRATAPPNTITISYSDIQGGEAGIVTNNNGTVNWEDGNIDEDPLFVGTGDYPYALSSGSPCIDVGNPNSIYNDPEDPNNPGYALWPAKGTIRNDMGAYGGPNASSWIIVGIEDDENEEFQTPTEFELAQNYPNPFNPTTTIQYGIKERASVELVLYDILGKQVVVLVNEEQDAGYYKVNFNAGRLASGIYFYRIQAGDFVESKKMVLLK